MTRIKLTDSVQDVIAKMSDGNPGATNTMCMMLKDGAKIDPQAFMGGLGAILSLDTLGIYGTDIYILYNGQCKRDIRRMLMLLRANQLGFIDSGKVKAIAADQMDEVRLSIEEMDELDSKVCGRLKTFLPSKSMLEDIVKDLKEK